MLMRAVLRKGGVQYAKCYGKYVGFGVVPVVEYRSRQERSMLVVGAARRGYGSGSGKGSLKTDGIDGAEIEGGKHGDVPAVNGKAGKPKDSLWSKVKHEVRHYVNGTKLLGYEIKVSMKHLMKFAKGYELSRRETKQLKRTMSDVFRLVPFSAFLIIPFAELLLPVVLKIFPNMLPSTYESGKQKEKKIVKFDEIRQKTSNFLQETLEESSLISYNSLESSEKKKKFLNFFRNLNSPKDNKVNIFTHDDIVTIAKMFKNDTVLDNLSRPQLVAMAKYMSLRPFGTDAMLRYQIRYSLKIIMDDDKVIDYEGVESLSMEELYQAATSRGIKTFGVSREELVQNMKVWLELRLRHRVPSVLMILSSAYTFDGLKTDQSNQAAQTSAQAKDDKFNKQLDLYYDGLLQVLSSIPDPVYNVAKLDVSTHKEQKPAAEAHEGETHPVTTAAQDPVTARTTPQYSEKVKTPSEKELVQEEYVQSSSDDNEFKLNVLKEQEELIRKEEEEAKLRKSSEVVEDNITLDEEEVSTTTLTQGKGEREGLEK
ncbi:ribosome-binding protein MDM38 Ecym_1268 [Eremothecium cymbalariae DBVPG|uniref:Letm1 RBD domain-containing protein n=1 Tax=Eremothecium cymbalariae (strain CBS 270.75 / DBVPG 7215 / KCTC 17166 / NRRL Y-17582) TaxID=931890 RepID=G8JN45_ERECY|nr:hypothetical protein Ecym_1268 [Eremothecium cymbalariae DBVPG\